MNEDARIYVAGHTGLVGAALVRNLQAHGFRNLLVRSHRELDLTRQDAVEAFFARERPSHVILAAAKVGGILANNTYRADFIYQNLMMAANVIQAAWKHEVARLLFLGSSCIYPRDAAQPLTEDSLLTAPLEATNEPYAIAKIAGVKLVESYNRQYRTDYVSAMPTNLYGPHDNFDLNGSHVLPAMMRKFHEAKLAGDAPVTLWGSGSPRREFLHVDDLAEGCLFVLREVHAGQVSNDLVNVGCGEDLTIKELALLVQATVGHRGEIRWDASKPDGTPRKLMDVARIKRLGWSPRIALVDGVASTYHWFLQHGDAKGMASH
ncbi:MAG: GDP-L-fucose synthase [Planctomycetes bacterium]|nr:GDP-L-fucose synthase [Planctomycetota bacterium]